MKPKTQQCQVTGCKTWVTKDDFCCRQHAAIMERALFDEAWAVWYQVPFSRTLWRQVMARVDAKCRQASRVFQRG